MNLLFCFPVILLCTLVYGENTPPAPSKNPAVLDKNIKPVVLGSDFDLNKITQEVQKKYSSTKSAQFSFEQTYKHAFLPSNEVFKGEVFFKEKNMLWRYDEPLSKKKTFYIKENIFTYHMISDKLAYTHNCFSGDALSFSISFLWGKGKLTESFNVKKHTDPTLNTNLYWLSLEPKEKNSSVKTIALGVNKKDFTVVETIVYDLSNGKNHFKFSALKTNIPLKDEIFLYKPQENVRLLPMPGITCPVPKTKETPTPLPKKVEPIKTAPAGIVKPIAPVKNPSQKGQ